MLQLEIFEHQVFHDVNQSEQSPMPQNARTIEKVRNIMTNQSNEICLVYDPSEDFYTFPGGQVEQGELPLEALERETLEETGATIKEVKAFAKCRDFRAQAGTVLITYYYESLVSSQGKEQLTADEAKLGIRSIWFTPKECMEILGNQKGSTYHQQFSGYRDLQVLKRYCYGDI